MLIVRIYKVRAHVYVKFDHIVAIHAIGDRANHIVLDVYRNVTEANGKRDRRFRIEHAQQIKEEDMRLFGQFGVIARYFLHFES